MVSIDGVTAEIIRSNLASAAEEMRRTLIRTAFNPVIYDVLDFGISLYAYSEGKTDLIAESSGIPYFLGANDYAIEKALEYVGVENLEQGDILIMNYPYWNAAHAADVTLFAPIFDPKSNQLSAFSCIRAHWIDLGAKDAGYVLDSTDMHQEGIIFPGTKIFKRGEPNKDVLELIRFNSRFPDIALGDLNAQVAATRVGEDRVRRVLDKYGLEVVREAINMVLDAGEKASLKALSELPHGSWSAEDYLDDDGITDEMIKMKATVTITDKKFTVDFTGSAGAAKGPVNMPFGATKCMCRIAFKALTTPHLPSNAGNYRPLEVIAPPGSLFHALYPSPTYTLWTGIVGLELICKAASKGLWDRIPASSGGDVPGFMMVGLHPDTGRPYALSNNEVVGWGASSDHDGSNGLQHHSTPVVRNTPIEVLEIRTGMMIERLEFIMDSGGAGKYRGGLGVRRDILFTAEGEFLSVIKKSKTKPWGLAGGYDAEPTGMYIYAGTDKERKVGTYRMKVKAGDRCILKTAGGGGYGNPKERDPYLVLEDVLEGYVSIEAAKEIYGVAIVNEKIDWEETKRLRLLKS
ncbi:MAG: hydantoinase B/oxoprolinase family protein [Nitrososphaerales archaeon]